ncbi:SusC/RagA family TonB-linked outer membrane protein [Mucinivorans hirudinis]|nr:SusC/RagA family TonB-linked outer membrane protein [Mucinivorans hirudinis]
MFVSFLFFGIVLAFAQMKEVKGTVVDEQGEPVIGATIQVKGEKSKVTVTDIDGKFKISAPPDAIIVVSFVGMKTMEVKAAPTLNITLQTDAKMLQDIVVTGMVSTDKRLFTGAADRLSASDVKIDGMADISRGLEGRSAGVSIQNISGTFGTAPKIRVRGATSIYGNSKPLWVVDGVIQDNVVDVGTDNLSSGDAITLISSAIAGLNPDDIESFQILKDGSATSIYGAKAMAGVIVITTKKGRKGVSTFSYTGEFTTRLKPNYRTFNIMNSQDQMGIYQELQEKGWLNFASVHRASNSGVYGRMYHLTHSYNPVTGQFGLPNTPQARVAYLQQAEYRNTDWFDLLFSNEVLMNHSVSMSTGTNKSQSYISLSMMDDPGWMKQSKVSRYTANLNNTYNITEQLSFTGIANASYREQQAPGTMGQSSDPVGGSVSRHFDINPYSYALNTSRTLDPDVNYTRNYADFNIFNELKNNNIQLNIVDLKFQGELIWKHKSGLHLNLLGALKYSSVSQVHQIKDMSNQAMAYRAMGDATITLRNPWLYKDPDKTNTLPQTVLPKGGFYNKKEYRMLSYDLRLSATFNKNFNDTHILNSYAGAEVNSQDRSSDWFDGWGMQYSNGELPFFDYMSFKRMRESNTNYYGIDNTHNRQIAFFATGTYSYMGKYTLTGTLRYEGTNRLGRARSARWLPTWNVALAWNMHEEKFFQNLKPALSHFTLKASYSLTADAGPSWVTNSNVVITSYNPWRPSANVGESGLSIDDLENANLTYEKKHELNIGVDIGFLNNRINLAVDWYRRNNFDLIGWVATQGAGGQVNRMGNVATMKSNGFEFTLTSRNIENPNFKWSTNLIFGLSKTEVTELKTRTRMLDLISGSGFAKVGYPHRSLFSIPFTGLDNQGFPIFEMADDRNEKVVIKRDSYSSLDFQQRENLDFLKYEGPTDPTITGSLSNMFSYKNWRLNVFITYSAGNKVRLDPVFSAAYGDLDATPKEFKNRWRVVGDESKTDIPVIASSRHPRQHSGLNRGYNAYNYSTVRVADGGFVRMKEISLQYSLPSALLSRGVLSSASLKLTATNLFLIYADKKLNGQDPEFFRSGGVSSPVPQQFTLTLRLGF